MVQGASDDVLVELGLHFGMEFPGDDVAVAPGKAPDYWHDGHLRLPIAPLNGHKQEDADPQTTMRRYGMSGFVAHNDINPTVEWQIEIETALATCELLVALIHPDFVLSIWCDQEIGYGLGRGVRVFAVRRGADPHGFVSRFQAFNGNLTAPHQIAKELFEAAIDHKKLQANMADVVIDLFVTSGTYALAKERVGYVERLKVWDPSYSATIARALKVNDQIFGSLGVSQQVHDLIGKWSGV